MQDTKLITLPNNSSSQPQSIQEQSKDFSFHDRAAIVARDILEQMGFNENKMRTIAQMTSLVGMIPPYGPFAPLAEAQKVIKDIEPLMLSVQNNADPGAYLSKIPQEKIEYFLNQVITRLEWIKNGNEPEENIIKEQQTSDN